MTQPREREVLCRGLCGNRLTINGSGVCDRCSAHPGECDKCGELAERTYRALVPLDRWNSSEERWCKSCVEQDEEKATVDREASDAVMYASLQRETWGAVG